MNINPNFKPQTVVNSNHTKILEVSENSDDVDIPQTAAVRWWWRGYSWAAYQLPNGLKVMSDRQMSLMVEQSKANVRNFVDAYNLETITVKTPNGMIIQAKTLPTAAAYLQLLLESGNLQHHRLSLNQYEWKDLIRTLSDNNLGKRKLLIPNPRFFEPNYRVVTAKPIEIEIVNNIVVEVLVLPSGEYRIGYSEGLNCIKVNPNWLLQDSHKKAKVFTRLKLSPLVVQCKVNTPSGTKRIHTLSCEDWLSIWEYFAKKRNRQAIAMLKACAEESIACRVGRRQ
ncbi:MAG: hypothetical protein QNJ47_05570 [Nostocaceae cyanobacterium]|nr:hypothetical protein [Nostocaceae cyanobacterium]